MEKVNISEPHPAGSKLFTDAETFLEDLTDTEAMTVQGGEGAFLLPYMAYGQKILDLRSQTLHLSPSHLVLLVSVAWVVLVALVVALALVLVVALALVLVLALVLLVLCLVLEAL